ncbi:MAG TPA: DUF5916 domain-containing protein [Vicinamibacterales bacterium]|nr:DUF5916 domain-containing protein [Vicinamibacterales bacterium]
MLRRLLAAVLGAIVPGVAAADDPDHPARTVQAVRAASPIVVDGRLDDRAWAPVPAAGDFVQRDPDEGRPATEATELKIAYDAEALYVGVRLHDREPGRIVRQLSRRDTIPEGDRFALYLDPHHDHLTGALFWVSAAGVQGDAVIYNDVWTDASWDAVWASAVAIDEGGWTVEMRIPFSQLHFARAGAQVFGINAMRHIQRKREDSWLVLVPKTESGLASRMGHLVGLDGIAPRAPVELLPYAAGRAEFIAPAGAADPFNDGTQLARAMGLDVKYRLGGNLTLSGTVNPDFGQVEVDPAVVNLTAFETFFEEKRPFFVEGADIAGNFGREGANNFWGFNRSEPIIFYSRRIGRAPQGEAHGDYVARPRATTILGAAKLTGRTRGGWTLALLEAVTGREQARTLTGGVRREVEIEPPTNYLVVRVRREIGRRGSAGLLATSVTRALGGSPLRDELPARAFVAGVDGHWFLDAGRAWVVTGRVAASRVAGEPAAIARLQRAPQRYFQRPDAPHVRLDPAARALGGWTGSVNLNRNSGIHLVNAALWATSPGFDANDAGFMFSGDRAGMHVVYQWRDPRPVAWARARSLAVAKWYTWNFGRQRQGDGVHLFTSVQLPTYWSLFGGLFAARTVQDDRATRGGPLMVRPGYRGAFLEVETDSRRRVSGEVGGELLRGTDGGSSVTLSAQIRWRPAAALDVSAGPRVTRRLAQAQYVGTFTDPAAVDTYGARYVFAHIDQREVSLQTRVNCLLSPTLSVQVYLQPLVSVGDYDEFKALARPRTYDFVRFGRDRGRVAFDAGSRSYTVDPGDGGVPFGFGDPDFNLKSLRVNAVLRWEWRPGSALYIAWTQERRDLAHPGELVFGRDFPTVFRAPADDVVLVKLVWWLSR